MNCVKWGREVLASVPDIGTEEGARLLERSTPNEFWSDPQVRQWVYTQITRRALRALGSRSIRRADPFNPEKLLRRYEQRLGWDESAYQYFINECFTNSRKYVVIGKKAYEEGTDKGYQLTLPGIYI